jgi:hypothetical protein
MVDDSTVNLSFPHIMGIETVRISAELEDLPPHYVQKSFRNATDFLKSLPQKTSYLHEDLKGITPQFG